MAIPNSKATLKQWCKRKLGYPVIDINIDEDQCDDRIDEALQYFYTFQYGGNANFPVGFFNVKRVSNDIRVV